MKGLITSFVVILASINGFAQVQQTERFLVPITGVQVQGAHGSLWQTELWYRNDSGIPLTLMPQNYEWPAPEAGGVTREIRYTSAYNNGLFYAVPVQAADGIRFHLRIRDLSRQHETWGTEIPVVRESRFSTEKLTLLNVPTDSRFRQALRMYESEWWSRGRGAARARISIYPNVGDQLLATSEVVLENEIPAYFAPGFAAILSLTDAFPAIRAADRVRIEIVPLTPGARLWAFVSVTHNETQHVTTITP